MDTQQQCSTQDGGTKTKKYTRGELFRLAKLMNNSQSISEKLNRFEHADWSQYNLDLIDASDENETRFNSIKSVTSYGPKNSELDHEYCSLTDHQLHNEWRRSQPTPIARLSRMTSSPSIRYGANNMKSQFNAQHDDVSVQIKAKYAKLIESMSANSGNQQQTTNNSITGSRSDFLSRDSSGSSWRSSEPKLAERPTTLFGPLRRETSKQKGDRRNSEEPMSLPYIPDHGMRNHHSGRLLPNTGAKGLLDYNNPSPVQRFTSSDHKKENQCDANEDDDFDITSLLNITVLSDIKIIRQDQQHHHGSNNRPTLSRQYSNRGLNDDVGSGLPGLKPLLRARTSTDFTYQGRMLDSYEADRQRVNQSYFAEQRIKNGSESLDTYRWCTTTTHQHVSTFENREMAREKQQNINQSKKNSAPSDKSAAQIIEKFKAQIKARAEEKFIEPLVTDLKAAPTSTYELPTCERPQDKGAVKETVPINFERKNNDLNVQREEKEVLPSPKYPTQDAAPVVGNLLKISDNRQQAKTEPELIAEKDQIEATCNTVQQNVTLGELATNKPLQSKTVSQIPRLIRLLDLNKIPTSSETKAVSVAKEQQLQLNTRSLSTSATTTTTTTTKAKPRFVSQYRRLRGKSLADEMEDMPK